MWHAASYDGSPASARAARIAVRDLVAASEWSALTDDAELCVGELVANAVLHAHGSFHLAVSATPDGIRIEVSDDHGHRLPRLRPFVDTSGRPALSSTTGRGLGIVAVLADRWGVDAADGSKVVWAEITPSGARRLRAPEITGPLVEPATGTTVQLLGMPVARAMASGMQVEDLVREVQLGIFDAVVGDTERQQFFDLLEQSAPARLAGRYAALAAAAEGAEEFDLTLVIDHDMIDSVAALSDFLETLPPLVASGAAPTPELVRYRQWIVDEVAAQLSGATPTPYPGD